MTRYARFPSLKGKNQRSFEESTPWDKLKNAGKKNHRNNNRKTNERVQNKLNDGINRNNKNGQKKKKFNNSNVNKFINWKLKEGDQGEGNNAGNEEDGNNSSNEQSGTIDNKNNEKFSQSKMKFKQFKNSRKSNKNLSRKKGNNNNCPDNFEDDSANLNETGGYKRRKPLSDIPSIYVDNVETAISRFGGFPVKKSDAERLRKLKGELVSMKIPRDERELLLKAERRRAEKALARERKKVCFQCRRSGHILSQCPELANADEGIGGMLTAGICFKCGSTEHKISECQVVSENYKFAVCFICKEEGHLSKQCPDNPRGLYPEGGACRLCGDVTHLKKDCPQLVKKKQDEFNVTAQIINNSAPEALDNDFEEAPRPPPIKKRKVIIMNK